MIDKDVCSLAAIPEEKIQTDKKSRGSKISLKGIWNWASVRRAQPPWTEQDKLKAAKKLIHYLSLQDNIYLTEGLFRVEGNVTEVDSLFQKIIHKKNTKLSKIFGRATSIPVLTTLLKRLFKEEEMQLRGESLEKFLAVGSNDSEEVQKLYSKEFYSSLPEEKKRLLKKLFDLMGMIAKYSEKNKMTAENLARSFAQNLIPPNLFGIVEFLKEADHGSNAFVYLLEHRFEIFC